MLLYSVLFATLQPELFYLSIRVSRALSVGLLGIGSEISRVKGEALSGMATVDHR